MINNIFNRVLIIGVGLIGSSIARAIKKKRNFKEVFGLDLDNKVLNKCEKLDILSDYKNDLEEFSFQFDLIIICTPLSTYKNIFMSINNYVSAPTLVTDVGSTKISVIEDYQKIVKNDYISFVPSHPIAGLEKSGPEYGFAELFENRYCILTPIKKHEGKISHIRFFWESIGMKVELMKPDHHDRVLAMAYHIPQLFAYSIVFTTNELEDLLLHLADL